jgi:hypothetical protein
LLFPKHSLRTLLFLTHKGHLPKPLLVIFALGLHARIYSFSDSRLQKELCTASVLHTKEDGQATINWRNNQDGLSRPGKILLRRKREKSEVSSSEICGLEIPSCFKNRYLVFI